MRFRWELSSYVRDCSAGGRFRGRNPERFYCLLKTSPQRATAKSDEATRSSMRHPLGSTPAKPLFGLPGAGVVVVPSMAAWRPGTPDQQAR